MRISHLKSLVRPFYSSADPSHDWAHVERVAKIGTQISYQLKAQTDLILAAIYCHDIENLPKNHPHRSLASTLSAEKSIPILQQCQFETTEIELITNAIKEHSFSSKQKPSHLISAIVQDSDRLDALGAIGILRCAAVSTKLESSFYDINDPLAQDRDYDDTKFMIDHYFLKLFELPQTLNTDEAKVIAYERIKIMKSFLSQLMHEIK
jgi:uncharacterized protein